MSERFAARVKPLDTNTAGRVTAAWRLAFGREPYDGEMASLVQYANRYGLANACRLIFNMNEFVFVD
jgi:hypothetical protein